MKRLLIITTLLAAALLCQAQAGTILTWERARELALQNNSEYQASQAEAASAKWSRVSAFSNFLPSVSLDGTWLYLDPATTVNSPGGSYKMNNDFRSFGFSLSQPLFLGGKLWQGYRMSQLSEDMAQTNLQAQKLSLLATVNDIYLSLLQTQSLREIGQLDRQAASTNLEIAKLKYDNGLLSNADYLSFQSRLASKEVSLLQAQTAMQLSQLRLQNYLGIDYLPLASEAGDSAPDPSLRILDSYDAEETANLTALAQSQSESANTTLKLLRGGVELSRRAYQISKGAFLPTVMLVGSREYSENWIDRYEFDAANQLVLSVSVPLLPQLGTYAKAKSAQFDYRKAQLQAQTAAAGVGLGIEAAVLNLVSAAKQVGAARVAFDFTTQSYEQMQERFRLNMISANDLLNAELALSASRLAFNNANYGYQRARFALLQILGYEDSQDLDAMIISGVNK